MHVLLMHFLFITKQYWIASGVPLSSSSSSLPTHDLSSVSCSVPCAHAVEIIPDYHGRQMRGRTFWCSSCCTVMLNCHGHMCMAMCNWLYCRYAWIYALQITGGRGEGWCISLCFLYVGPPPKWDAASQVGIPNTVNWNWNWKGTFAQVALRMPPSGVQSKHWRHVIIRFILIGQVGNFFQIFKEETVVTVVLDHSALLVMSPWGLRFCLLWTCQ